MVGRAVSVWALREVRVRMLALLIAQTFSAIDPSSLHAARARQMEDADISYYHALGG